MPETPTTEQGGTELDSGAPEMSAHAPADFDAQSRFREAFKVEYEWALRVITPLNAPDELSNLERELGLKPTR